MSLPPYIPKLPGLRCTGQVGVPLSDSGPGLKPPPPPPRQLGSAVPAVVWKFAETRSPWDLPSSSTDPFLGAFTGCCLDESV